MTHKILSIILLTCAALVQLKPIQPDVSYTGKNDRFDLTEMVSAHKKMFRYTPLVDDDENGPAGGHSRRNMKEEETVDLREIDIPSNVDTRRLLGNKYKNILLVEIKEDQDHHEPQTRRFEGNFAEDDSKNSFEGGTVSDFEENLKKFYAREFPGMRRLNDEYDDES